MRKGTLLFALSTIIILTIVAITHYTYNNKSIIILDPGHGGNIDLTDRGATGENLHEADINLDISLILADILEQKGYQVVLTRKNDTTISLQKRVEIANSFKDQNSIFISIHQNTVVNYGFDFFKIFLNNSSNPHQEDLDIAKSILSSFEKLNLEGMIQFREKAILYYDFYVLRNKNIPGVLIEVNHLTPYYEEWISKQENKKIVAEAIAEGIDSYFKS